MTQITLKEQNGYCEFSASGHAGAAQKGKDIVCAGISALCMALSQRISQLEEQKLCEVKKRFIADGEFSLEFSLSLEAKECLLTVLAGFECIAEVYPDFCNIQVFNADCP